MATTPWSAADAPSSVVGLILEGQRYALPLGQVERVIPLVEITMLPKAPAVIMGVIDVRGSVIPVVNIRKRFGLPDRVPTVTDKLVIAQTRHRRLALVVDAALGVLNIPRQRIAEPADIAPRIDYLAGVARLADGMILIHDLDQCLDIGEERDVDIALAALRDRKP